MDHVSIGEQGADADTHHVFGGFKWAIDQFYHSESTTWHRHVSTEAHDGQTASSRHLKVLLLKLVVSRYQSYRTKDQCLWGPTLLLLIPSSASHWRQKPDVSRCDGSFSPEGNTLNIKGGDEGKKTVSKCLSVFVSSTDTMSPCYTTVYKRLHV